MLQRKVDHQRMLADVRTIRENVNRARGYLRRDDLMRCIEAANDALMIKSSGSALGLGRSEVELLFRELCDEFSKHPRVVSFLEGLGISGGPFLRYKAGTETLLIKKLTAFRIKMQEVEKREKAQKEKKRHAQKDDWMRLAQDYLRQKNYPKGKVLLRRVVDTFGTEPEVARNVGKILYDAGLLMEAAQMFAYALEKFPTDQYAWRMAIATYDALGEFKKAEQLYLNAVRAFGAHPKTYLNLAKFYLKWHKRDDAYDYAVRALDLDPNMAEAKAIRDKLDR